MTGIFFTISLLWLFTTVCHTLDIPLQSALLIRGEPVGFTRSSHRQKRSDGTVTCTEDEYKPTRKAKHCCNKCLPGFRVFEDCAHEGMKSTCKACDAGYFRKSASGSKSCSQCADCLTQFGQVTLQPCTTINDTVCGCPAGQYKSDSDRKFTCLECSKCDNGTVLHSCTVDRNTVCKCFFNFYLDSTGNCRTCKECNDTDDCVNHCPRPPTSPVEKPEESNINRIIIPCVAIVAFLAVSAVLIIKNRKKISSAFQTAPTDVILGTTTTSIPLMDSPTTTDKPEYLPGQALIIVEDSGPHQNTALNSSLPLPDITLQTKTPCLNRPEDLYKIIECVPVGSWRELIRRLGVSDQVIDQSEYDYRRYKDAQYAMLSSWAYNEGSTRATRDSLFRVLREMNLGGCVEKIEESL